MNPYEPPQSIIPRATIVKEPMPEAPRRRGLGFYLLLSILLIMGVLICLALLSPIFYTALQFQHQQEQKDKRRSEAERLQAEYQQERLLEEQEKQRQRNLLLIPPGD